MVFVHLKQSKTDQLGRGVTIVLGRTGKVPLCPVSALLNYLVARGKAPGPLFIWSNGQYLTRAHFVAEVQKALELSGVDSSDFNGHSFRIGAATTAAANGFEDSLIRTLGRWESDAYRRYIKIPRQELAHYTVMLTNNAEKKPPNILWLGGALTCLGCRESDVTSHVILWTPSLSTGKYSCATLT